MLTKSQKNAKLTKKSASQPLVSSDTHLGQEAPPWGWIEIFLIAQLLSPALLFLPGSQALRPIIRGMPYASSIAMWIILYMKSQKRKKGKTTDEETENSESTSSGAKVAKRRNRKRRKGKAEPLSTGEMLGDIQKWIKYSLFVLAAGLLLHPDSLFVSGAGYFLFHLSIAAPIFWVQDSVKSGRHLNRIVWIIFASHLLSAEVGALQIYYPDRFMPPEFTQLGTEMNADYVESLSYQGADGEYIIRPPGLTDMPGGAAISGMFIGFLGVTLATQLGINPFLRFLCLAAAGTGVFVLYLTQVRSLFLMMIFLLAIMCFLLAKLGRWSQVYSIGGIGAAVVIIAFSWAVTVGGDAVRDRFLGLVADSPLETYQEHRGGFLWVTYDSLINNPLGRGVGRWGMVPIYLPPGPGQPKMLHAEIQMTGWAFDGGVVMIVIMFTAIGRLLYFIYRQAITNTNLKLAYLLGIAFCSTALVFGQSFAGPSFSTSVGVQFWFLGGCVFSIVKRQEHDRKMQAAGLETKNDEDTRTIKGTELSPLASEMRQPQGLSQLPRSTIISMPEPKDPQFRKLFGKDK